MAKRNHELDAPILMSARAEFLEKGFENASLKSICENAGVTTGAVYKRYKDKEALFAAVVEETVNKLNGAADMKCDYDMGALSDEELLAMWNMDESSIMWWFEFLDDVRDDFVLLISRAETTRYAHFQHDWVEKMTDGTYECYEEMFRRGLTNVKVSRREFHILLTAFWTTFYEPFVHGYSMEEIKAHSSLVCRLFDWKTVLGLRA